jgi:hypothetical protein
VRASTREIPADDPRPRQMIRNGACVRRCSQRARTSPSATGCPASVSRPSPSAGGRRAPAGAPAHIRPAFQRTKRLSHRPTSRRRPVTRRVPLASSPAMSNRPASSIRGRRRVLMALPVRVRNAPLDLISPYSVVLSREIRTRSVRRAEHPTCRVPGTWITASPPSPTANRRRPPRRPSDPVYTQRTPTARRTSAAGIGSGPMSVSAARHRTRG